MGESRESISKFLIGNRFHVKLHILSPSHFSLFSSAISTFYGQQHFYVASSMFSFTNNTCFSGSRPRSCPISGIVEKHGTQRRRVRAAETISRRIQQVITDFFWLTWTCLPTVGLTSSFFYCRRRSYVAAKEMHFDKRSIRRAVGEAAEELTATNTTVPVFSVVIRGKRCIFTIAIFV